ncbi:DUF3592 domain-containing protein [Robbsia andropogonis]|uniref:DUF3592 domain-containing protein n=2 Tax=Robbsia andropogonis TaxID=28092 RepID=UPI0009DF4331
MIGFYIVVFIFLSVPLLLGRIIGTWASRQFPGGRDNATGAMVLLGCCVIAMFCYYGVDAAIASRHKQELQLQVQNWQSTEAVVKSYNVVSEGGGRGSTVWWTPVWTYTYEVNNVSYSARSNSINGAYVAKGYDSKVLAEEGGALRPNGSGVVAYYNPNNPEESVLDRRLDKPSPDFGLSLLMFLLAAPCVFLTSMAYAIWRRQSDR